MAAHNRSGCFLNASLPTAHTLPLNVGCGISRWQLSSKLCHFAGQRKDHYVALWPEPEVLACPLIGRSWSMSGYGADIAKATFMTQYASRHSRDPRKFPRGRQRRNRPIVNGK